MAGRTCTDCQRWLYMDAGEKFAEAPHERGGQPVPRPQGSKTPCRFCPKIPQGCEPRPENAIEPGSVNWQAWRFYRECRAVGEFPRDALVRYAAGEFRALEDSIDRVMQSRTQLAVLGRVLNHAAPGNS